MKDFNEEIIKLSKEYVSSRIDNPTPMDYIMFENAMLASSVKTMELVVEKEKEDRKSN